MINSLPDRFVSVDINRYHIITPTCAIMTKTEPEVAIPQNSTQDAPTHISSKGSNQGENATYNWGKEKHS